MYVWIGLHMVTHDNAGRLSGLLPIVLMSAWSHKTFDACAGILATTPTPNPWWRFHRQGRVYPPKLKQNLQDHCQRSSLPWSSLRPLLLVDLESAVKVERAHLQMELVTSVPRWPCEPWQFMQDAFVMTKLVVHWCLLRSFFGFNSELELSALLGWTHLRHKLPGPVYLLYIYIHTYRWSVTYMANHGYYVFCSALLLSSIWFWLHFLQMPAMTQRLA